jgi:predicted transcriptional regulator
MKQTASPNRNTSSRHSILDFAPLELECMRALWPLGEGTVRDIYLQLAIERPRAYTTIMTIMDRLARKGIVTRRKVGHAYRYQATLSAAEARASAVKRIVTAFFDGSAEALAAHLAPVGGTVRASEPAGVRPAATEPSGGAAMDETHTNGRESEARRPDKNLA